MGEVGFALTKVADGIDASFVPPPADKNGAAFETNETLHGQVTSEKSNSVSPIAFSLTSHWLRPSALVHARVQVADPKTQDCTHTPSRYVPAHTHTSYTHRYVSKRTHTCMETHAHAQASISTGKHRHKHARSDDDDDRDD
eukprot:6193882-Pleurochrysis_carterae.AAC.1